VAPPAKDNYGSGELTSSTTANFVLRLPNVPMAR